MGRTKQAKKSKTETLFTGNAQDIFYFVKEAKFITKGNGFPVLNYVRFMTGENKVRLIASDLELFLTMEYELEEIGEHDFILLIEDLYKIFDSMKGQVTFKRGKENYQIVLEFDKEKHTLLKGNSPDLEYPDFAFFTTEKRTVVLPKDNLWFVQQATSNDETRYNLNGVCCVKGYGLVSTDGHRLHVIEAEMKEQDKIYPRLFIEEMIRITKFTKHQISFTCRKADKILNTDIGYFSVLDHNVKWSVYTKMVDARFPLIDQIIPSTSEISILLESKEATRILNRVKKFCSNKNDDRSPYITMRIDSGRLFFVANRADSIVSELEMNIENLKGGKLKIGVNANYMLEALKKETEKVTFEMTEDLTPIKVSRSDGSYAIVMPSRLAKHF